MNKYRHHSKHDQTYGQSTAPDMLYGVLHTLSKAPPQSKRARDARRVVKQLAADAPSNSPQSAAHRRTSAGEYLPTDLFRQAMRGGS